MSHISRAERKCKRLSLAVSIFSFVMSLIVVFILVLFLSGGVRLFDYLWPKEGGRFFAIAFVALGYATFFTWGIRELLKRHTGEKNKIAAVVSDLI